MVVFFENTELTELASTPVSDLEGIYNKTIAEKFVFEKKMIVKELQQQGILAVLTSPEKLTVQAVNKYLELKSKQAI
jgi:CRISPR/Cas system-associated protein Cas7 (RAMP superfamily)